MKKTLFVIAASFLSYSTFAQLSKGTVIVNGTVSYSTTGTVSTNNLTAKSSHYDSTAVPIGKTSSGGINLSAGYFVADNLAIGLSVGYNSSSTLDNMYDQAYYSFTDKNSSMGIGLFATKYFSITNKFYFTGTLNCSLTSSNNYGAIFDQNSAPPEWLTYKESVTYISFTIAPGLTYFPTNHWAIRIGLNSIFGYSSSTTKGLPNDISAVDVLSTQNRTTNAFSIGAGLTPTLGVSYVFGNGSATPDTK